MASSQALDIAVEYLDYRLAGGETIACIAMDVWVAAELTGWSVGRPDYYSDRDSVVAWLAVVYEDFILPALTDC